MPTVNTSYLVRHLPLMVLSVLAWIAFATFYRTFWVGSSAPGDNLGLFWIWMAAGTAAFVIATFALLALRKTRPAERAGATLALTAPALVCDIFTINFFDAWFPNGGGADDRIYAAMIVGVVGLLQLAALATTHPETPAS